MRSPRAAGVACGGPLFSCAPPSASPPADLHDTLVRMTSNPHDATNPGDDTSLSRAATAVVRKALEADPPPGTPWTFVPYAPPAVP